MISTTKAIDKFETKPTTPGLNVYRIATSPTDALWCMLALIFEAARW